MADNTGQNANNSFDLNINGKIYTVKPDVPPRTSLLQFLREFASLKGTKGLCYEGGCGVCTVVVTFTDQETGKQKTCCVKSCQTLLYSCAGWRVETIEYLGNRYRGYHSLQKAMVGFSGTQCGFCSPGFVMTMYGEMKGKGKLTQQQIENSLDGNICRCTGYRPILDAFKSLASDAPTELLNKMQDIEESYKALCPKTGELCRGKCSTDSEKEDCLTVDSSTKEMRIPSTLALPGGIIWEKPKTLNGLYDIMRNLQSAKTLRLVVGNTGEGVYKSDNPYDVYVDTTSVPELYTVTAGNPLVVGANVSLQRCVEMFREVAAIDTEYSYLEQIASHWENIANTSVRNVGSWAGNLMLKHQHKEFPSDIFVTLAVLEAVIKVGNSTDSSVTDVKVEDLINLDLSRRVILSMTLPPSNPNTFIRTYKISPRAVNAHAYVNAGFKFHVDPQKGFQLLSKPSIVYGGINPTFVHAAKTEAMLTSERLTSDTTLQAMLNTLANEIIPNAQPVDSSPRYRLALAQSLLFKAIISIVGNEASPKIRSGGAVLSRPVSSGRQAFDLNNDTWPIGQAIPKLEANIQVSGEAEYVDDMDPVAGELFGAFVQSSVANAKLDIVDASAALKLPGVVSFISEKDVPGANNFYSFGRPDPIFVSTDVQYHGQSIGLIVATSRETAMEAVQLVKVTYKDVQKPVLSIKDVIKDKPFAPTPDIANTVEGEFEQGSQFHFMLEPMSARVIPVEDGYDIFCTTQWPTMIQMVVAETLGINNNSLNVSVKRLGGGFGGKISRPNLVACAAAVASHKLQKPVRVTLDLKTHMTLVGWRDPYYTKYKVGFDNEGLLQSVDVRLIADAGSNSNETSANYIYDRVPNVYFSPKWVINPSSINTNTAANTPCRTPGFPEAIASMENMIERIAAFLKKDPAEIREKNFLDMSKHSAQPFKPRGENLIRTRIFPMIKEQSNYVTRKAEVRQFNEANRWKKRGISIIPLYYSLGYPAFFKYNTQVVIYAADGTVVIAHGGIEMGQGLNTKTVQVAAKYLNVPLNYIKVKPTNVITGSNSVVTGGSYGSDLIAFGVQKCCESLRQRMDVIYDAMVKEHNKTPTWLELVSECLRKNLDLSERYWTSPDKHPESYDIFAAACMEVELDVLTGQYLMLRTDLIEDCGRSLSPYVDIGQIEGAFIMGLGFYTSEEVKYDPVTGEKVTNNSWTYKPPTALDIPTDLRITLLPKGDNKHGVVRSKATGEPALCLSYCVVTALREAITSARADAGFRDWFEMTTPLTVEKVQLLCKTDANSFSLKGRQGKMLSEEEEDFHLVDKSEVPPSASADPDQANCLLY